MWPYRLPTVTSLYLSPDDVTLCAITLSNCTAFCTQSHPILMFPKTHSTFYPSVFIPLYLDPCFHLSHVFQVCHPRNLTIKCPFPSYWLPTAPLRSFSAPHLWAGVQALALTQVPSKQWPSWGHASLESLLLVRRVHLGQLTTGEQVAVHHLCQGNYSSAGFCIL